MAKRERLEFAANVSRYYLLRIVNTTRGQCCEEQLLCDANVRGRLVAAPRSFDSGVEFATPNLGQLKPPPAIKGKRVTIDQSLCYEAYLMCSPIGCANGVDPAG